MNTDHDRLLKENEERARRIKEELIALREAMLRSENELNVLAIERTNLESAPCEERIEIPPELRASIQVGETIKAHRVWPNVAIVVTAIVIVMLAIGSLGIFDNDDSTSIVSRSLLSTPHIFAPSARKDSNAAIDTFSSIPRSTHVSSTSDQIKNVPDEVSMNILPGITYTSEISYSMKSSVITLVEVQDSSRITLHLNHAPQSFFIPMWTPFRIEREGIDSVGALMVFADSRKRGLEIRFEPRNVPLERKILGVSSSQ